jgi:hypothetical protein
MGRFESFRSQDTGRQASERGGQTPSTHPLSFSYGFFTAAKGGTGGSSRSSVRTSRPSRKIKEPVEGRFSPRSTIPLLAEPGSQRQCIGLRTNEGRPDNQGCQEAIEVRTLLGPLHRDQSAAMRLDRALGASLAQQMIGTAQTLTKMSPSAREDSATEERASAIRQLGLRRQLPFPVSKMSQ